MGGEWRKVPFGDLYHEPSRNGLTKPKKIRGAGVKFINMGEIFTHDRILNVRTDRAPLTEKELKNSLLEPGDLLFARQSLVLSGAGKCSIFLGDSESVSFESHLIRVRLDKQAADPKYYYYFFRSPSGRAAVSSIVEQGAGASGIRGSDLTKVEVTKPPLPEQQAIAHILGALDDKIGLNRQMNRTLEQMAQAIFKSWFIDFDPVVYNAVRAGNPIPARFERAAVRYRENLDALKLPRDILELFPDGFEDSEVGGIPAGWSVKPIGDVVRCVGGATPSTKNPQFWEGGTNPFLTPKDMSSLVSPVITGTSRHITDAGVEKINSKQIPSGAVMLSSRAPIGYLGINEVPMSINQGIIAMICEGELPNYYVLLWTMANMDVIRGKAGGTTFAEISKKNFRPIPALVPSPEVLNVFSGQIKPLYSQVTENIVSNGCLESIRDTLLPKLISGRLAIPDAGKLAERVA